MQVIGAVGQGVSNGAVVPLLSGVSGDGIYHVTLWTPNSTCYIGPENMSPGSSMVTEDGGAADGFLLIPNQTYEFDILYEGENTSPTGPFPCQLYATSTDAPVDYFPVAIIYVISVLKV